MSGDTDCGLVGISGESATQVYSQLLRTLIMDGEQAKPRGMASRELRPVMTRIYGERRWVGQPTRKLSTALGVLEGLQVIGGFSCPAALVRVAPQYARFINPGNGELDGGYGPRLGPQLPYVFRLLRQDPATRQAVVTIFGGQDQRTSLDVPCTLSLQFFIRHEKVELQVDMRSNDAWLGWPYDVIQFSMLQAAVAAALGLDVGVYTHVSGSMHLYERNLAAAERVAEDERDESGVPPVMPRRAFSRLQLEAQGVVDAWWNQRQPGVKQILLPHDVLWGMPQLSSAAYVESEFFQWCLMKLRDHTDRDGAHGQ